MKEIEKLAIDASRETGCSECGYQGFMAGFRKAREMAAELSVQLEDPKMANLWHWQKQEYFRVLGESEISGPSA